MAGKFTRRCAAPRPSSGVVHLERCDWLVEIISIGEVLIIADRTYLELCSELDRDHYDDWELWDRE